MKAKLFLIIGVVLLCLSCEDSSQKINDNIYKVDLDNKIDPFGVIFSKAELIPIETDDSCLVGYPQKVYPSQNKFYLYDFWFQNLLVFEQSGKYLDRVGKKGQGPNEYLGMFDCYVDTVEQRAYFLSVFGHIKCFDFNSQLVDDIVLPARPHYYSMALMDNNKYMVTWSCLEPTDGGGVLILNKETNDTIRSDWHDDRMFDNQEQFPFHKYGDRLFFATGIRQQVYEVTLDGLLPVYLWDFGKNNIKESTLDYYLSLENPTERNNTIIDDIGTERLPFCMHRQNQNKKYSYVALQRKAGMRPPLTHVFYDKEKQKSFVFDNISDVCPMSYPLYFGDDYILTDIFFDEREKWKSILPASEYQKLESMKEDDNPCLLKLYFK